MDTTLLLLKRLRLFISVFCFTFLTANNANAQCTVSLGPNISICPGQTDTLTVNVASGNPNYFTWNASSGGSLPSGHSAIISPSVTTTYIVHASGNGCNTRDTIVVTVNSKPSVPSFTFNPNNSCSGSIVNFNAISQGAGISFGWNFGDGVIGSGTSTTHSFNSYGTGTGNFVVTLIDTNAFGCINTSTQTVNVAQGPGAVLSPGGGVDTMIFNGYMTFYKCAGAAQQISNFTFLNSAVPSTGLTSTILWGDTGAPFTTDSAWTNINHIYSRGIYTLTYIVNGTNSGCSSDTTIYKVFLGSNPAGGIASPGNTDICGPGYLTFVINNVQNNTPGTIYIVSFNDSTPTLTFSHPPPDTITHLFQKSSCGVKSSNGSTVFNNSFAASLTIQNPCGITAGAVLPIYVSLAPIADYIPPGIACTGTNQLFLNTTIGGMAASSSGCDNTTPILWHITPSTGWSVTTGNLGSDNGFAGQDYDPSSWSTGSNILGVDYSSPGNYQMRLVAANSCAPDTVIKTVCVSAPPAPSFVLSDTSACAPVTISTTNNSPSVGTCSAVVYSWGAVQNSFSCPGDSATSFYFTGGTNSNSDSAIFTFNNQGIYTVSLNAQNVCGAISAMQTVKVNTKPQVAISAPLDICAGQTVSPTAVIQSCGGMISSYSWNFLGGAPSSSNSQNPGAIDLGNSGQHNIGLIVSNECGTASASRIVTIDTIPVANAGNDQEICSGGSAQLGAVSALGLNYFWTPATGLSSGSISNPTVSIANNGTALMIYTYYLTVSNATGCSSQDTVIVTVYPAVSVNAGPPVSACSGKSISLSGTYGGSATSASWVSSNGGIFSNDTSAATIYTPSITSGTVTLTLITNDPSGPCPASNDSMIVTVVPPPVANSGPDTSMCSGSTIQIGGNSQSGYNYLWTPPTGLNYNNQSNPSVTLTNNTNGIITQTYTLAVSATGCADTAQVTISVFPNYSISAGSPLTICGGDSVILNGSISGNGASVMWSSATGSFSQPDSLITIFTPTIGSGIAAATLSANSTFGSCPQASSNVNVTVNPIPTVTNTPSGQVVCSGASTHLEAINSTIGGTTFAWTAASANGVTGFISSGMTATIPAQILINDSATLGSVVYTIIPSANGCSGSPFSYTITVNPLPQVLPIPSQTICTNSATTIVVPNSNISGTSFSWTATSDNNLSGFMYSGAGNIPAQTISNSGNNIDSVMFSITPVYSGCLGNLTELVVFVNPLAQANLPANQTICSGDVTANVNLTSNYNGGIFNWTTQASSGITGMMLSGTGDIPGQTIFNSGVSSGTVTFTITTSIGNCPGPAQNYSVTVNPLPVAYATPTPSTVCSGVQTNISLSSNLPGTNFMWTSNAPAGITGATNGSGNFIQQILINNSQTTQVVTYVIIPTANGCPGQPDTAVVTVNPGISVQFSPANQTICSGQSTGEINISSPVSGVAFTWTSQSNGVGGVANSGTDSIPTQILTNNSNNVLTVNYTVDANYNGCIGQAATYQVQVNPIPQVYLPASQSICTGISTLPVNISSAVSGTTFSWSGFSPNGVTGYTANGSGITIPSQTLVNTYPSPGSVVYTITPSAAGCPGPDSNYVITVNPSLIINPVSPQTICSGATSQEVAPVSNTDGATFYWSAYSYGNISGYMNNGVGNIPAQTITNYGNNVDSVIYIINSSNTGCPGNPANFVLYVNPLPQANNPASQVVCSGTPSILVSLNSNVNGATFTWTSEASPYLTGYIQSGTGDIPSQTIFNSGYTEDSVRFNITAWTQGCNGPVKNCAIKVNPASNVNTNSSQISICSETQTNINLNSTIIGTTFSWVANAPASVLGASGGSGNLIQQVLTNSSQSPQTVTYIVTPGGTSCAGNPDTINVVVTPGVDIQLSSAPQAICSGQSSQQVDISSATSGVAFSWIAQSTAVNGFVSSGSNTIPSEILTNNTTDSQTVVYNITGSSPGCPSKTGGYSVTVYPIPTASLPASQTTCSGQNTDEVIFSSSVTGSYFLWSVSSSDGLSGFADSGNTSTIPSQILNSTGYSVGNVIYSVIPNYSGCAGSPVIYTYNVNPLPDVITPGFQTICNGATTDSVILSSHVPGTNYSWYSSASQVISGNTANGMGNIPTQTLFSTSTQVEMVVYSINPVSGNCPGVGSSYIILVNPSPVVIPSAPQVICSGGNTNPVELFSATPGVDISWAANIPNHITGADSSGTNIIPVQNLYNSRIDTFPVPVTINYTTTAVITGSGCPAVTDNYSITVLPIPHVALQSSVDHGCSPLSVNFVPTTFNYGAPDSLVYNWGDGTPNAIVHPSQVSPEWYSVNHIFYNTKPFPITYNVSLRAHNGCFDTTIIRPITVAPNAANAFFTASPASGCEPLTVNFHDQSGGASLLNWCFNYDIASKSCNGSGVVDTAGSTISHTFSAGTYTVALYVNSGYQCAHDTAYQVITVDQAPVLEFNPTGNLCAQAATTFVGQLSGDTSSFINQYNWQFGDGNSSTTNSPTHLYNASGTYNVCLTVTSGGGCINSICHPVTISQKPQLNFVLPDACVNKQAGNFQNLSTGADFYLWSFGDGGASTSANPEHKFSTPGDFNVMLVGTNNNCSDTIVQQIAIYPSPHAAFTTPVPYGCGLPSSMQLTNTSTGAVAYEWNFGNGSTSEFENPLVTYNTQGTQVIALVASNQFNCQDTAVSSVNIYPLPVVQSVQVQPAEGCNPLNVNFKVNATNASQYVWDFGDGQTLITDASVASHLYTGTGTYSVQLKIYSFSICGDTLMLPDTVVVHINPTAAFDDSMNVNTQLENGTVQFINYSVNSNSYEWNFGDGVTSTDINPSHMFADVEQFHVMLVATNQYGCKDTAYKDLDVIKKTLFVPNAFAPDFEGGNELVKIWKPVGIALSSYHAQIFDKWGELLWESTALTADMEPAEGWDGTYRGKVCQQGAYVWKIEATFADGTRWTGSSVGKEKNYKTIGSVTLIR